jgi:hypothetical protein
MPHRDDREALDAKLEAQSRELAEAKEELERLRAANLRKATELERLKARADSGSVGGGAWPRAGMPPGLQRQIGVLVVAASLLVGGLSFSAIHLAARAHRAGCHSAVAAAAPSTRPVHASFDATLARASGMTSHQSGEACRVDATFQADARTRVHALSALAITCAEETLYAPSHEALADAFGLAWASETDGRVRYELVLDAGATRIESWDGTAVVAIAGSRIELALTPLSDEVELALSTDTSAERVMVRTGHVTASTTLALGTACTVARRPAFVDGFSSRVVVRCGEHTLYGAAGTGYTYAGQDARLVVDADPTSIDGDARMTLDLVRGTVHLGDGLGLAEASVDITFDPTGPTTDI